MKPLLEVIKKHSSPGHLRAAVACRYLIMEGSKIHSRENPGGCSIREPCPIVSAPVLRDRESVFREPEQHWCVWGVKAVKKLGYGWKQAHQTADRRKHRAV